MDLLVVRYTSVALPKIPYLGIRYFAEPQGRGGNLSHMALVGYSTVKLTPRYQSIRRALVLT
jgi:hypothetical protein